MKIKMIVGVVLLVALFAVNSFWGCAKAPVSEETAKATETVASTEAASTETQAKKILIGVSLPNQKQTRWNIDKAEMEKAAKELGADIIVQFADDEEKTQASQVENMITQKIDVLILAAINADAGKALVDIAKAENIPVVGYDRLVSNADLDIFITRNNYEVGEQAANLALEFASTGNYAIVSGDEANMVAHEKTQGYHNVLDSVIDSGDIKIVSEQWNRLWATESALKQVENALTANNNDIVATLCNSDSLALGAIQAIAAQNLTGKVFVSGEDVELPNAQAIVEGRMNVSSFTPIGPWASAAVESAVDLALGKAPKSDTTINNGFKDVPARLVSVVAVTKDNMNEVMIKTGMLKLEDVYKNVPEDQWPKE